MRFSSVCFAATVIGYGCREVEAPDPESHKTSSPSDPTEIPTIPPIQTNEPETTCTNPVVASTPADASLDVFYRTVVSATLLEPDETAVLTLSVDEGEEIVGTSIVDGDTVRFESGWLTPSTPYVATLQHACGTDTIRFTTSVVGSPVEVDLVGRSYALDLSQGSWLEPAGSGVALEIALATMRLLVGVTAVPGASGELSIDLIGGAGINEIQSPCAPTVDLAGSVWEDPYFSATTPLIVLQTESFGLRISDFTIHGAFSPDGTFIQGAGGAGEVDTRALGAELGLGTGPTVVCDLLATLGTTCAACDDGVMACMYVVVEDIPAVQTSFEMIELTAEDIASIPACQ